jgi:hypothetical protein
VWDGIFGNHLDALDVDERRVFPARIKTLLARDNNPHIDVMAQVEAR